jgi:hypothetical protein
MIENSFMNIKNRSRKITAERDIPAGGGSGAILSFLGLARYTIAAPDALATGPATVTLDFAYDGGGFGKGGKPALSVNGKPVAERRVEKTQSNILAADVGIDNQTPVAEGIGIAPETRFSGKINKITLEVGPVK